MHLVCPHCGKAHIIRAEALGAGGRNVRCAACKNTWFVTASGTVDMAAELRARRSQLAQSGAANGPNSGPTPHALVEQVRKAAAPLLEKPLKRLRMRRKASAEIKLPVTPGAAVLMGLFLLLASGLFLRESVVRTMPSLAGLYGGLGLKVNVRGLEFTSIVPSADTAEGQQIIVIEGKITNISGGIVKVPPIRVVLRSPTGTEIQSAIVRAQDNQLDPKGDTSFKTRLANPAQDAKDILVRFTDGAQRL